MSLTCHPKDYILEYSIYCSPMFLLPENIHTNLRILYHKTFLSLQSYKRIVLKSIPVNVDIDRLVSRGNSISRVIQEPRILQCIAVRPHFECSV